MGITRSDGNKSVSISVELLDEKIAQLLEIENKLLGLQIGGDGSAYNVTQLAFYQEKNISKGPCADKMQLLTTELSSTLDKASNLVASTRKYLETKKADFIKADGQGA